MDMQPLFCPEKLLHILKYCAIISRTNLMPKGMLISYLFFINQQFMLISLTPADKNGS